MLVSGLPCRWHAQWLGGLQRVAWFYSLAFEVGSFSCAFLRFQLPCPSSLSGKYKVSILVTLLFSVKVPGGCRSQGCLVLLCSCIFPGTFPKLIYCWWVSSIVLQYLPLVKRPEHTLPDFLELWPEPLILQCCRASLAMSDTNFCAAREIILTLQKGKCQQHHLPDQDYSNFLFVGGGQQWSRALPVRVKHSGP